MLIIETVHVNMDSVGLCSALEVSLSNMALRTPF